MDPPKETPVPPASLANCEFNDGFTLAASRDTKTNQQELLVLYNFSEEEDDDRKPVAKLSRGVK
jgi:hypothetical protein